MARRWHKLSVVFYPFLFALFPVLSLFSHNVRSLIWADIVCSALTCLALALGLFLLLWRIGRDANKAGLFIAWLMLLFFSYGHFYTLMQRWVNAEIIDAILLPCWLLIFFFGAYVIWRHVRRLRFITPAINIMALTLICMPLGRIIHYQLRNHDSCANVAAAQLTSLRGISSPSSAAAVLPDIYYIILDAYARNDVLRQVYQYDNTPFLNDLARRGFYVAAESCANYAQTCLSLSSTLNMNYLDDVAGYVGSLSNNLIPLRDMIDDNAVFHFLRQQHYTIVTLSSGVPITEIRHADLHLSPAGALSAFEDELAHTTPLPALRHFLKIPLDRRRRILYTLEQLRHRPPVSGPVFVFAHILAPHAPFIFHADGTPTNTQGRDPMTADAVPDRQRDQYIRDYRDQLAYISKEIQGAVEAILAQSPRPPIIIIQSDHGPASRLNWEQPEAAALAERMRILYACYFPDADYAGFSQSLTPVNTFRLLFNHYFNAQYELLPNRCYFSSLSYPYKFRDVTVAVAP